MTSISTQNASDGTLVARGTMWGQFVALVHKDLALQWRNRARVVATAFFALTILLLFSFSAGPNSALLQRHAAGYLWLALLLSSQLSLGEMLRIEQDNDAMEGMRLLPIDARLMFLSKALVSTLYLFVLGGVLLPLSIALYGYVLAESAVSFLGILFLGSAAISAPGTLYSAIAVQARGRDVLLPLLLFPVLIPSLLAAVKATSLIVEGDPMAQLGSWSGLLVGFNVVYWVLGSLLFGRVIEE